MTAAKKGAPGWYKVVVFRTLPPGGIHGRSAAVRSNRDPARKPEYPVRRWRIRRLATIWN